MLGDPVVTNPISWLFGECSLDLTLGAPAAEGSPFQPKPEIKHLFREPEARPPQVQIFDTCFPSDIYNLQHADQLNMKDIQFESAFTYWFRKMYVF